MTYRPLHVHINGTPVAQPRPRARRMGAKGVVMYTPKSHAVTGWRETITTALRAAMGKVSHKGFDKGLALAVSASFYMPRPKSHLRADGTLKSSSPVDYVSKPDLDNLIKPILDVCTEVGVFHDDSQVMDLRVRKFYADPEYGAPDGRADLMGCDVSILLLPR